MSCDNYCKINNKFKFSIYSIESILADKMNLNIGLYKALKELEIYKNEI